MAESSGISWTDGTWNPWIGCTKVSPACKFCYAERDMDHRYHRVTWGPNGTRVVTSDGNWKKPLRWNRLAADGICIGCAGKGSLKGGVTCDTCDGSGAVDRRQRVFCASLADIFEDWKGDMLNHQGSLLSTPTYIEGTGIGTGWTYRQVTMDDVRTKVFELWRETPHIDWLVLTKRPENIKPMGCPQLPNLWLGTTVESQEYADKRIPELLKCRDLAPVLFLSCEPLVGPIEFSDVTMRSDVVSQLGKKALSGIDWVIAGGESGPEARPSHPDWFRSLRDQCAAAGVPFHFKQWGCWVTLHQSYEADEARRRGNNPGFVRIDGDGKPDPHASTIVYQFGVKTAGRLLDGVEHNAFPEPVQVGEQR